MARLIQRVTPEYPPTAKIGGAVLFQVLIGTDGHVRQVFPANRRSAFIPEAAAALMQWVYQPTTLNGKRAEVSTLVPMDVPYEDAVK